MNKKISVLIVLLLLSLNVHAALPQIDLGWGGHGSIQEFFFNALRQEITKTESDGSEMRCGGSWDFKARIPFVELKDEKTFVRVEHDLNLEKWLLSIKLLTLDASNWGDKERQPTSVEAILHEALLKYSTDHPRDFLFIENCAGYDGAENHIKFENVQCRLVFERASSYDRFQYKIGNCVCYFTDTGNEASSLARTCARALEIIDKNSAIISRENLGRALFSDFLEKYNAKGEGILPRFLKPEVFPEILAATMDAKLASYPGLEEIRVNRESPVFKSICQRIQEGDLDGIIESLPSYERLLISSGLKAVEG